MAILSLLKSAIGVGEAQPPPPLLAERHPVHVAATNDNDNDNATERGEQQPGVDNVDAEKYAANATPVEAGVGGIQAAQAIWGKHGRWLIIAG